MAGREDIGLTAQVAAVVHVRRADEQPVGLHEPEEPLEVRTGLEEVLDDLARDHDREPPRRRFARVVELGVVAEADDVGDGHAAHAWQGRDVVVVQAATRAVDEDVEVGPSEDVDGHLGHVELAALAVGGPDARLHRDVTDGLVLAVVVARCARLETWPQTVQISMWHVRLGPAVAVRSATQTASPQMTQRWSLESRRRSAEPEPRDASRPARPVGRARGWQACSPGSSHAG